MAAAEPLGSFGAPTGPNEKARSTPAHGGADAASPASPANRRVPASPTSPTNAARSARTPSAPTSSGRPISALSKPTVTGEGGREVLGMEGPRPALLPTPSPSPTPRSTPSVASVADAVPEHAARAVADQGRKAAPQPDVGEKIAATERRMAGEEPEGTIVEGIEDDQLWVMLRGFNKQVNHVLHPATSLPPTQPDLRQTNLPNVPYRSDTLKANLERLIKGLGPPAARGIQELAHLTDWDRDFYRTAAYCGAYFLAWGFGVVVLGATIFFIVLICFPRARRILFPYRPPETDVHPLLESDSSALLDDQSYTPVEASQEPMTAPERDEEASVEVTAVLSGFASALLFGTKQEGNAVVGPKDLIDDWDDPAMQVHDENGNLIGYRTTRFDTQAEVVEVRGKRIRVRKDRVGENTTQTEVERKRDELVTWMAKSTENTLGSAADYIEILQKALSPPPVYPDYYSRYKLGSLLVLPALALHFVPARLWGRGLTLAFGIVFWGRTWLEAGLRELLARFPNWKELVDPRNSILSGVPTDAQLTLHLLRVSENEKDPLPAPPMTPALQATKEAIRQAPGGDGAEEESQAQVEAAPKGVRRAAAKGRKKTKGVFRRIARKLAGMGSDVAVVGEEKKLSRKIDSLVLKAKWGGDVPEGGYRAKLEGTSGHLFIDEDDACISWVPLLSKNPDKIWYVDDLVEMKKDGVGVSRLALAAMSGAEIASLGLSLRFAKTADDISLSDMSEDEQLLAAQRAKETLVFKGVEAREALFNRLIAMGSQRWEML